MKQTVAQYIKENTLVFDGSMGTYYAALKENSSVKCELANVKEPEVILEIHRRYVEAGCRALKTNTFAANRTSLECDGELLARVIHEAWRLACQAAGEKAFVFADIGPIPTPEKGDNRAHYYEVIDLFLELGAQNFLFETFSTAEYLPELTAYIKKRQPESFILTSFAVSPDGYTRHGMAGQALYRQMSTLDTVDAVGFNCVSGPFHLLRYIQGLELGEKPLSVMPNAGYPTVMGSRTFFNNNPAYFARQMVGIAQQGAKIIGGCCGTNPQYLQKTVELLSKEGMTAPLSQLPKQEKVAAKGANRVAQKLAEGKPLLAVELDPPLDADIGFFMEGAKRMKALGVDLLTIADCPIARARVDSSLLACKVKRELDLDPLPHMTCRDRNVNATKALLLGLNIEGVNNVLVVTGDPIPMGDRGEIKSVFNFNSAMLANFITDLNQSTFQEPFVVYGALNVNAANFDVELEKAKRKTANGMTVFLTQPVMTDKAMENLKRAYETLGAKILGGILPVVSHKNALFMESEISGISVSQEIIDRFEGLDREQASALGIEIAVDIAKKIRPYCHGLYLITPFKRVEMITEIVERLRET